MLCGFGINLWMEKLKRRSSFSDLVILSVYYLACIQHLLLLITEAQS